MELLVQLHGVGEPFAAVGRNVQELLSFLADFAQRSGIGKIPREDRVCVR